MTRLLSDNYQKSNPPGAVGVSIALETIIQHCSVDIRPFRWNLYPFFYLFLLNEAEKYLTAAFPLSSFPNVSMVTSADMRLAVMY